MTGEDKNNDESKTRKNKKIVDVLMDDGEWSRKKKFFRKKKKEQKPQTQPQKETSSEYNGRSPEEELEVRSEAEVEAEEKMRVTDSENSGAYLSEIERNVLREILMGASSVNEIIRSTSYPEVIVKGAIERLISKDFIDRDLNPTEKVRGVSLKKGRAFTVGRKKRYRLDMIDVAIIVAILLFLLSLVYYMGFLG